MRQFPLFIFDNSRTHGLGEVDFVVCTSKDYGFVGEFSFVETNSTVPLVTSTEMMTEYNSGVGLLLSVKRYNGEAKFEDAKVRTLMRKAYKTYLEQTAVKVGDEFSKADAEQFCKVMLAEANRQFDDCGIDDMQRRMILASQAKAFDLLLKYIKST